LDIHAYLHRINYDVPLAVTPETLRTLHYAHLLTVPFENVDIPERPIVLDEERFYDKIVRGCRGGFCYELNGLFAALLRELGFRVTLLSGRVPKTKGSAELMEFDHLALRVDLEDPWLADVGFGESFVEPLPLTENVETVQRGMAYRLERDPDGRWRVMFKRGQNGNGYKPLYDFTLTPHALAEFAGMCGYHQTSPLSPFMQRKICSRLTPTGRITVANMRLIITDNGSRQERALSEGEYRDALRDYFGIGGL
jgi:N-hydroxyarylamine O-acetyltransferase